MKRPRINDFDPNAAPPLGSSMDHLPSIQQPSRERALEAHGEQRPDNDLLPSGATSDARPYGRTTPPRIIKRHAFEFFQDQLDALQRLSLQQKFRGEKGSMSEMVRAALDAYLRMRQ